MPYRNIDGKMFAKSKILLTLLNIYGTLVLPLL